MKKTCFAFLQGNCEIELINMVHLSMAIISCFALRKSEKGIKAKLKCVFFVWILLILIMLYEGFEIGTLYSGTAGYPRLSKYPNMMSYAKLSCLDMRGFFESRHIRSDSHMTTLV